MTTTDVPDGFHPLERMDAAGDAFAPLYLQRDGERQFRMGFRVGPQHCNPRGNCHGGTWAMLADILMGINVGSVTGLTGPTVSMSIDFIGAATIGQWVEGNARILRHTHRLGFAECLFTVDGAAALRSSAVFRRKYPPGRDLDAVA